MAPFGLMAGAESLFMIAWAGLLVFTVRKKHFKDPIILWLLLFTLLWATQYGLTTAGNLGSLVRYRLQVLPMLLTLLILLSAPPRLGFDRSPRDVVWRTSKHASRQITGRPLEHSPPIAVGPPGPAPTVGDGRER